MASSATTTSNTLNAAATIVARGSRLIDISVSGVNGHTVEYQRTLDGTNWRTVEEYTADIEKVAQAASCKDHRLIVTGAGTGNVTMLIRAGNSY